MPAPQLLRDHRWLPEPWHLRQQGRVHLHPGAWLPCLRCSHSAAMPHSTWCDVHRVLQCSILCFPTRALAQLGTWEATVPSVRSPRRALLWTGLVVSDYPCSLHVLQPFVTKDGTTKTVSWSRLYTRVWHRAERGAIGVPTEGTAQLPTSARARRSGLATIAGHVRLRRVAVCVRRGSTSQPCFGHHASCVHGDCNVRHCG